MPEYRRHLYAILYPRESLVASQLPAGEFGRYYSVGSARFYVGKVVFAEVDPNYRHPDLPIDRFLEETVAHADGSPKRTKTIASYRVLERLDIDRLRSLSAVTERGEVLTLHRAPSTRLESRRQVRLILEIAPLTGVYATTCAPGEFGCHITRRDYPKGCPTLFFAEIDFDEESFLEELERNPFLPGPLPGVHPQKLKPVLEELKATSRPVVRHVGIHTDFRDVSYRRVPRGFFLSHGANLVWFPFPSERELQEKHYRWWRTVE